jgi:WD40 repeat protein
VPTPDPPPRITCVIDEPGAATTGHSWVVQGFRDPILALAFSPDSRLLATGGGHLDKAGDLRLWDLQTWNERHRLVGHGGCVNCLAFSPDGSHLVTGGFDQTLRLWEVATGQQQALLSLPKDKSRELGFTPNRERVAFASFNSGLLMAWDPEADQGCRLFPELTVVTGLAFDPTGRTMAIGTPGETTIFLVDAATGRIQAKLQGPAYSDDLPRNLPCRLAFSRNGRGLAVGYLNGDINLWDVAARRLRLSIPAAHSARPWVALQLDGDVLACGDCDGTVTLTDVRTGREIERWQRHEASVISMACSPDGRFLATASMDKTVILWERAAPRQASAASSRTTEPARVP